MKVAEVTSPGSRSRLSPASSDVSMTMRWNPPYLALRCRTRTRIKHPVISRRKDQGARTPRRDSREVCSSIREITCFVLKAR